MRALSSVFLPPSSTNAVPAMTPAAPTASPTLAIRSNCLPPSMSLCLDSGQGPPPHSSSSDLVAAVRHQAGNAEGSEAGSANAQRDVAPGAACPSQTTRSAGPRLLRCRWVQLRGLVACPRAASTMATVLRSAGIHVLAPLEALPAGGFGGHCHLAGRDGDGLADAFGGEGGAVDFDDEPGGRICWPRRSRAPPWTPRPPAPRRRRCESRRSARLWSPSCPRSSEPRSTPGRLPAVARAGADSAPGTAGRWGFRGVHQRLSLGNASRQRFWCTVSAPL